MDERRILNLFLKFELTTFIQRTFQTVAPGEPYLHNWHVDALAYHLERCFRREIKRLVITLPPRYGKSICASVAFPAWALGHDPSLKFICASYAQDLAEKLARDCRAVLGSAWYREVFPGTIIDRKKNTAQEIATLPKGGRLSTSVGGALTGLGGNFLIIDDPMKAADASSKVARQAAKDWLDGTALSRLNNKNEDVIILIMQRLHIDDLAGHVLGRPGWVHLDLPAVAEAPESVPVADGVTHERSVGDVLQPARESREKLEEIKRDIGTVLFSAQYQQAPVPPSGNIIKRAWLKYYRDLTRQAGDWIVQSWDTAMKPEELHDYSVGTTWLVRGADLYLIDVTRERLAYTDLKKRIIEAATRHRPRAVLIEDKVSGTAVIQDLRAGGPVRPIAIKPDGDKVMRMSAHSAKFEAGRIYFPERAPWLGDLAAELLAFPDGRYDDQVDSIAQALAWLDARGRNVVRQGSFR